MYYEKFVCKQFVVMFMKEIFLPEKCPQCKAPASSFSEVVEEDVSYTTEHVVGIAKDVEKTFMTGLLRISTVSALKLACIWR